MNNYLRSVEELDHRLEEDIYSSILREPGSKESIRLAVVRLLTRDNQFDVALTLLSESKSLYANYLRARCIERLAELNSPQPVLPSCSVTFAPYFNEVKNVTPTTVSSAIKPMQSPFVRPKLYI